MPLPESIFAVSAYLLMKRLISLLAAISLFAGCENSENSGFIQVWPSDKIFLDSEASEATLTVTSSGKWNLTEADTWVTVTLETSPGNMEDLFMNTGFTLVTSDTQATRSTEGRKVVTPSEV